MLSLRRLALILGASVVFTVLALPSASAGGYDTSPVAAPPDRGRTQIPITAQSLPTTRSYSTGVTQASGAHGPASTHTEVGSITRAAWNAPARAARTP